jgi:hypothetical protein
MREVFAELGGRAHDGVREPVGCAAGVGVVDAARREDDVLQLEVAAGGEGAVALGDYGAGVLEAGYEGAAVDEGEGVKEGPVVFGVFDYEAAVGGDAGFVRIADSCGGECWWVTSRVGWD